LCPGVKAIRVNGLYPGDDSLLHVGVCCKSLASQKLLMGYEEQEITGPDTADQTSDWLWRYSWEVTDNCAYSLAIPMPYISMIT